MKKLLLICLVAILLFPTISAYCSSDSECKAPQRCTSCVSDPTQTCCNYYLCSDDSECRNGEYCTDDGVCHLKVGGMIPQENPDSIPPIEPTPSTDPDLQGLIPNNPQQGGVDFVPILLVAILVVLIALAVILAKKK